MRQGCVLYILRSKGQRSRSQCINYWKWFPAHNYFLFTHIIMKLHMQTPHESRMCLEKLSPRGVFVPLGQSDLVCFRTQEPKAPVTYCDHALSVVRKTIYIFNFFSRTAWWILMKLCMDEVLMVPYRRCFVARSAQGWNQGGAKIGHGVPFFNKLLLQSRRLQRHTE